MIKYVLFDLDGTLIDTEPGIISGLKIALTKYGYEIPDYQVLKSCIGPPFLYSFPNILGMKQEDVQPAIDAYRQYYDKENGLFNSQVYPGIKELLGQLKEEGFGLLVCSSKPEPTCIKLLENKGLAHFFDYICGATLDGKIDNKVDVIKLCFSREPALNADNLVLVGDTKYDALGAKEAGIACIGVSWGFGSQADLLDNGAVEVFDSCQEIFKYVKEH